MSQATERVREEARNRTAQRFGNVERLGAVVQNVRPLGSLSLVESGVDDPATPWQERALCAQTDPEAFFPEKGASAREAKRVCMGCVVRMECLQSAIDKDERFGVWGGLSERERRKLTRRVV